MADMPARPRRVPLADVLARLNYPITAEDRRGGSPSQSAKVTSPPAATETARGLNEGTNVIFCVAGGFEFSVRFLDATLSECGRYMILTMPVADSGLFKIGDGKQSAEFTAVLPEHKLEVRTTRSEKSFDFTVKGLRFFVFPVLLMSRLGEEKPAASEQLPDTNGVFDDDDAEREAAVDDDSTIETPDESYTNGSIQNILFGDKSPRGDQE